MTTGTFVVQVGESTVTVLDSGLLVYEMAAGMGLNPGDWGPRYAAYFEQPINVPMQHLLIQTPHTTVLVDAGSYDLPEASAIRVPGYTPPPPIHEQLRGLGIAPESVEHVVITHLHLDHYNGLTEAQASNPRLCYPNATVHVSAADWSGTRGAESAGTPGTPEYVTLGVAARAGKLATAAGRVELAPGVEIVPMPGETPGHQGVRVASEDDVLYAIGDLIHHPVELAEPEWHTTWADHASMMVSRTEIFGQAEAEGALVVASHIAGAARVRKTATGWEWLPVESRE
jgi:glyoxylase-like metal-dependent hydrolase (beta-lactamase superfamily II)